MKMEMEIPVETEIDVPAANSDKPTLMDYFEYDDIKKETRCVINNSCTQTYRNCYPTTLWRHLQKGHHSIYNLINPDRKKRKRSRKPNKNSLVQLETRKDLVRLVTCHGRPLSIMSDTGMKNILNRLQDTSLQDGQTGARVFTRERLDEDIEKNIYPDETRNFA